MKDLLAKRAALIAEQRALVDAAKTEGRDLTEEEVAKFEAADKSIVALDAQIERERKLEEREQALAAAGGNGGGTPPRPADRDTGGFANLGEFVHAIRFGDRAGRLSGIEAMEMGTGTEGGFAVPEQFRQELLELSPEDAIVRPRANVIPAGDPPDAKLTIPALDQSVNLYGGVEVSWIAEGGQKPETGAKLLEVSLEPQEVAAHVVVTDRLLRNWQSASAVINRLLRGAISSAEDLAFLKGNGVGKPLGVLGSAGAIAVNRGDANKVAFADVVAMRAKLHPESVGSAVWVANQSVLTQIVTLQDANGNSIFIRGDVTRGIPDMLLGIPIRWTGRTVALGAKGDLALVDFRYYLIKDGSGPFIGASEHVFFRENKTVIKVFWNVDGQSWVKSPLTLEDGSTQVSPYVLLDVPAA